MWSRLTANVTSNGTGFLTLGEAAARCGVSTWKVQSVIERSLFPAPPKVGNLRVIAEGRLDELRVALAAAGYMPLDPPTIEAAANTGH